MKKHCCISDSIKKLTLKPVALAGEVMLAAAFGVLSYLGTSITQSGDFYINLSEALPVIAFSFLVSLVLINLLLIISSGGQLANKRHIKLPTLTLYNKKSVFVAVLLILAIWMFWIVAYYPGMLNWDTFYQITMCYPHQYPVWEIPYAPTNSLISNIFSDHHPLFTTLLYGVFARSSDAIFNNWSFGIFFYCVIQTILFAFELVIAIAYLERWNVPNLPRIVLLFFLALFPVNPIYGMTMLKNSTLSLSFIPYTLLFMEVVRTNGRKNKPLSFWICYLLTSLLVSLSYKTGVYIVIVCSFALLLKYKKVRSQLLVSIILPATMIWLILPKIIFPLLDVAPGGKQEMLAVPFQQTARLVKDHKDDLSASELNAIDRVLNIDTLADRYDPFNADPVKFLWNKNCSQKDLKAFFSVWAIEGLKHPITYLKAWFIPIAGYFSPSAPIGYYPDYSSDMAATFRNKIYHPKGLKNVKGKATEIYSSLSENYICGIFFQTSLYAFYLPAIACLILLFKDKKEWLVLLPILICQAILLITPVMNARYALQLIQLAPILFTLSIFTSAQKVKIQKKANEANIISLSEDIN